MSYHSVNLRFRTYKACIAIVFANEVIGSIINNVVYLNIAQDYGCLRYAPTVYYAADTLLNAKRFVRHNIVRLFRTEHIYHTLRNVIPTCTINNQQSLFSQQCNTSIS